MKNYSRQREAILNVLHSTDTHPTAAWVYDEVRKLIPNISLGTVYRNLAALSSEGEILSLSVGDGYEHFDGDNSPHLHLHCRCCGRITDAVLCPEKIIGTAEEKGFLPESTVCIVYGICKECNAKK